MAVGPEDWKTISMIVVPVGGALALVPKMLKEVSESLTNLSMRGSANRKERMELYEVLDAMAHEEPAPRAAALEAKLIGLTGKSLDGEEVRALMLNPAKAREEHLWKLVRLKQFVSYSSKQNTFVPREPWTMEKIRKESRKDFRMYLLTVITAAVLFAVIPPTASKASYLLPIVLSVLAVAYAFMKASQARRFLEDHQGPPDVVSEHKEQTASANTADAFQVATEME